MKIYDADIRKHLADKLFAMKTFHGDPTSIWVDELDVYYGMAIVDVAVINGKMHGYEIKSPQDTLERLPTQASYYSEVFDTVTLVVSEKFCDQALTVIPDWWGVYSVLGGKRITLKTLRRPKQNPNVCYEALASMLWKSELQALLSLHGYTKGIKSKTRRQLAEKVAACLKEEEIAQYVRSSLKHREGWKARRLQQICGD